MKIAVLLGGLRFDSQRRIVNGILEKAVEDDANIYVFTCDAWTFSSSNYNQGETAIFSLPDFSMYDGVILHGDTVYDGGVIENVVEKIKVAGVPCVSLGIKYPGILYMGMENEHGVYEITEHFVKGHRAKNLAFISGPKGNRDSEGRLRGFRRALADCNVKFDERYLFYGDYHPESGSDAVEYFYKLDGDFPDAIVAANDEMALGAFYALSELGYDVPGQVRLSGYDHAYIGRNHYPKITSVKRPELELGRQAYSKLKAVISGEVIEGEEELQSKAVFSESCGCVGEIAETDREFRRSVVKEKIHVTNYSEIVRSSSADFTGVETFEELLVQIRKYIEIMNPREFYLCMCVKEKEEIGDLTSGLNQEESEEEVAGYSSEIRVPISYRNGRFWEYDNFDVKSILPKEVTEGRKGQFYTVVPVHYQHRCFGYCVLAGSRLMMDSELFHLFIMNINNALENIRKQNMLNAMVEKLNKLWIYDTLTGVFNRAGFFKFAYRVIEEARSKGNNLFVLFLDMDGLKSINDKYGHDEGDEFIKAMGKVMSQVRRHGELLMRYGGDEFVIMAQNFTQKDAEEYIARIRTGIENYNVLSGRPYLLDASMGYTIVDPTEEFDLEELIESADREMYKVKNEKKRKKAEEQK